MGAGPAIERIEISPEGEVRIGIAGEPGAYYILYRGNELASINVPAAMALGEQGTIEFSDGVTTPATSAQFYRVRQVPVVQPLDSDGDGMDDAYELGFYPWLNPLEAGDGVLDFDEDGRLNLQEYREGTNPWVPDVPPATSISSSPRPGETGVAVTRETIVQFSEPLSESAVIDSTVLFAEVGGRKILSRVELSRDRLTATLFYLEPLPGSARIRVTLDGDRIEDIRSVAVDADGDGLPGGRGQFAFETLSLTPVPSTAVIGQVFASELGTGPDGQPVNRPLPGVTITVDGREESLRAVTDAEGRFRLEPVPAGEFFVHIDGRTSPEGSWPGGSYYPFVGKSWTAVAGRSDNLAGGTGEVFLPLIPAGSLQPVSPIEDTPVAFPEEVLQANPEFEGVSITVPANSLFSDDGRRGGLVGIAPVPPDRLPAPLPEGLTMPIVITVQTDGPLNFDQPAPVCFPNLPDPVSGVPLPAGSRQALISFNHDKGIWEAVGSMTVSADGRLVCSDPDSGIVQPGWHGVGPTPITPAVPGACGSGGGGSGPSLSSRPRIVRSDDRACQQNCILECKSELLGCWKDALAAGGACGAAGGAAGFFLCSYGLISAPAAPVCALAGAVGTGGVCAVGAVAICAKQTFICFEICDNRHLPPCNPGDFVCFPIANPSPSLRDGTHPPTSRSGSIARADYSDYQDLPGEVVAEIQDRLTRIQLELYPYLMTQIAAPPEVEQRVEQWFQEANELAGGDVLDFLNALALEFERALFPHFVPPSNAPAYPIRYAAAIRTAEDQLLVLRGMTRPFGDYELFIPRGGSLVAMMFYDDRSNQLGVVRPFASPALRSVLLPVQLSAVSDLQLGDFDADDLPDEVELVLGTDPAAADSDGDGIPDGAEVLQGTDPLDGRPVVTGIIASADTPGLARDVTAFNDIALVADDAAGVAIFSTRDPQRPILATQLPTPSPALRVAWDGAHAAVALGAAGLGRIELPSAESARLVGVSAIGNVRAVAVEGDIAYAGLSQGFLAVVDLRTGLEVERLAVGGAVHDAVLHRDRLLVATSGEILISTLAAEGLRILSRSPVGFFAEGITQSRRVFAGEGVAMVTSYPGYDTFDFRLNSQLRWIGRALDVGPNSFKQVVANGSGMGIAAVGVNPRPDGTHDVWLYDLRDPTSTDAFLSVLPTPGMVHAVSVFNGLAYAADGDAGLQVLNYLPYDNQGMPPLIELNSSLGDSLAEEGEYLRLTASVTDDVQVRNVTFFVDGRAVAVDGNYPFEARILVPLRTVTRTHIQVEALATDTGGNQTRSRRLTLELVKDARPPRVTGLDPVSPVLAAPRGRWRVSVSEWLDPATLAGDGVRLIGAGLDGIFGTADDSVTTDLRVDFREDLRSLMLELSTLPAPGDYRLQLGAPLADRTGNALVPFEHQFRVLDGTDADEDGLPDELEPTLGLDPARWDTDGDGLPDGLEDFDGDGLANAGEILLGTDPTNPDSNGNGIRDGAEDQDADGLSDGVEYLRGTNPWRADTDGDGWSDEVELAAGSKPVDAGDRPVMRQVGAPPVRVIASAVGSTGGLPPNTRLATPPVSVVASAVGSTGGLPRNTVVARPPVTARIE